MRIWDMETLRAWRDYERKNEMANEEYERNRDTIDRRYGDEAHWLTQLAS